MSLFPVTNFDKEIYETMLKDFLPDKLIDIHTHVYRKDLEPKKDPVKGEVKRTVTWPSLVAQDNSIEDLKETYRLLFPGKEVTPLMFASSVTLETQEIHNNYVKESAEKTGYPALYFSHPKQSGEEIREKVLGGGFLGLKSYLSLSPIYLPVAEIRIFDFFPKEHLEVMNDLGGIVMLHIPRNGRLKDPINIAQICEIKEEFPNVRLIVAHIGRAYTRDDVGDAFEILSRYDDLMFDFCANTCEYAMIKMLEAMGPQNVLFGSDFPILRMRTRRIEENGTYINLVPPGLYGDPNQDPHLREVSQEQAEKITFFMYEEILAFQRASQAVGLSKNDIELAFYTNAKKLIEGVRKDMYGTM
ncbi:MAG: amidohydrolase family protein [Caldicoprobacterales bacterium]|jgi:hypothetical protein